MGTLINTEYTDISSNVPKKYNKETQKGVQKNQMGTQKISKTITQKNTQFAVNTKNYQNFRYPTPESVKFSRNLKIA